MNKTIGIILVVAVLVVGGYFLFKNQKSTDSETNMNQQTQSQEEAKKTEPEKTDEDTATKPEETLKTLEKPIATIETSEGTFKVTLEPESAPLTVANFIKLSKQGFYNNLKFHRIVQDFMIQGGDPKGDGTGGPGYTIPAEIKLLHTKGAIAMARLGDAVNPQKESSGSQFYVTLEATSFLDGQYTVFGYVTTGMDVVGKIGLTPTEPNPLTGEQSSPLKDVIIKKITIEE